jgi:hypothetical protein
MTTVPGRNEGVVFVVCSLVLSVIVGWMPLLWLLRDQVHLYCFFSDGGESYPGSWFCSDGIAYIIPIASTFVVWTLIAGVAIMAMSGWVASALRPRLLAAVALTPLAYLVWITADAIPERLPPEYAGEVWTKAMLGASVLFAVFALVVLCLIVRPDLRVRRASIGRIGPTRVFYLAGGALLLGAAVAQPGGLSAMLMAAGVLAASFMLELGHARSLATAVYRPE